MKKYYLSAMMLLGFSFANAEDLQNAGDQSTAIEANTGAEVSEAPMVDRNYTTNNTQALDAEALSVIPVDAIYDFVDVFQTIRHFYVEEMSDEEIMQRAIQGMLLELDPHSAYLKKEQGAVYDKRLDGEYVGVGIVVDIRDGFLRVVSPVRGGPAEKAGIKANDKIIKINGELVEGKSIDAINQMLKGERGETIEFSIMREDRDSLDIAIVLEAINLPSVTGELIQEDIAYIRINEFQADTGKEFGEQLTELVKDDNVKGVVLDLRNNPGGVIESALTVINYFLDDGLVVSVKNLREQSEEKFYAKNQPKKTDVNVVVLINQGSASAAELVTAALQDRKRALVLGEKSYGKGSVQNILPLSNGDAIKLTTGLYYTPNGYSIQARGIVPDIAVPALMVSDEASSDIDYREENVPGHLTTKKHRDSQSILEDVELAKKDFQLFEAINMLRLLSFYQAQDKVIQTDENNHENHKPGPNNER